ncbi:MAG TPA: hypothetical protein PLV45_03355 [bacterium]|nr:hypothetical protein [bacterium]
MKWLGLIAALILAFITAVTTLDVGFISDDFVLIDAASEISVMQSFTSNWLGERDTGGFYRPLSILLIKADHAMHGMNARGFHWTNLWLHLMATLLSFTLVLRIRNDGLTATVAAALFAVHPVHTEAISWISGRTDLLCAVFYLLSLNFFLAVNPRQSRGCLPGVLALVFAAGAMLSKEMGYTLPLMIILLDRLEKPRDGWMTRDRSHHYTGYFVLLAAVLVLRYFAVGHFLGGYGAEHLQFGRIATYLSIYFNFLIEPFAVLPGNDQPAHIVLVAGLILVSLAGLFTQRTRTAVTFWWITLLPVLTICRAQYLYLPSLGLFWVLGILIRNNESENRSPAGDFARVILSSALVLSCLLYSGLKQQDWKHSGWVAGAVESIIRLHAPDPPDNTRFVLLNPPQNNRLKMGVFQNGFSGAVRLWYGNRTLDGIRVRHPETWTGFNPDTDVVFRCDGAEIRNVTADWRSRITSEIVLLPKDRAVRLNRNSPDYSMDVSAGSLDGVVIVSNLSHAVDIPENSPVARCEVIFEDGHNETFDLLAGIHTSEWAYDRPDLIGKSRHSRAPIAATVITGHAPHPPILSHHYRAPWYFDATGVPVRLNIRFLLSKDSGSGPNPEVTIREITGLAGNKVNEEKTTASDSSVFR